MPAVRFKCGNIWIGWLDQWDTTPDRVNFKGTHPIVDTPIFLTLIEGEPTAEGARTAEVQTACRGPSLGSAGGPTLMHLGAIARLTYEGIVMPVDQGI